MKKFIKTYINKRTKELGAKFKQVSVLAPNEKLAFVCNSGSGSAHRISVMQQGSHIIMQELIVFSDFRLTPECLFREVLK